MPYTEAQKRANKKWREANRDRYLEGVRKWKDAQPDFATRTYEYVKRYRERKERKDAIRVEFMALCSIDI
jgi:hypothetical protein